MCVGGGGNDNHPRRRVNGESYTAPDPRGAAEEGDGLGDLAASDALPGDEMSVLTKAIDFACAGDGRVRGLPDLKQLTHQGLAPSKH